MVSAASEPPLTDCPSIRRMPTLTTAIDRARGNRALYALGFPAFRRIWLAAILDGFGNWMERLAVGWFVLNVTGSVFLAALSFAVRSAPNIVLGPFGGAVADRFERPRVLMVTAAARALLLGGIAGTVLAGLTAVWPILVLVMLSGVARSSEIPAAQAMITDIVGRSRAASAIGLHAFGVRSVGVLGAFAGGVLIEWIGVGLVFLCAGAAVAAAALVYAGVRVPRVRTVGAGARSLWGDALEGIRLVLRIPVVLTLLLLAVGVEVFAFSFNSLLPAVAERVLNVDAAGLGALTLGAGVGGMLGTASLSLLGDEARRGPLLLGVTLCFGVLLIALAPSERFALSLAILVGVGAMAAMFDALQWVLLQASVPDEMRGRVVGAWMSAIGFGWMGPIVIGATAEVAGTQWALAASGAIALALGLGALGSRGLRGL